MEGKRNGRTLLSIIRDDKTILTDGECGRCTGERFVVYDDGITFITWCNHCGRLILVDIDTAKSDLYVPDMSNHLVQ